MRRLAVEQEVDDLGVTLIVRGELEIDNASLLREEVEKLVGETERLTLDLSNVGYLDTTGLATIVWAHSEAKLNGWTFKIRKPSDRVRFLIVRTGLDRVLPFE